MQYKTNWEETKQRFDAWFAHKSTGRPVMKVTARRPKPLHDDLEVLPYASPEEMYCDVRKKAARIINISNHIEHLADGYPSTTVDLGAGTLALYAGSEPLFTKETVWFTESMKDYSKPLRFDPENKWFVRHKALLRELKDALSGTDILLALPDIVENIDILSAMRGPQNACYDLYDYPEEMKAAILALNGMYDACYDEIYDICKTDDGYTSYMCFDVLGKGKTVKVQCDMSAMLSKDAFDEFVFPALQKQVKKYDNVIYHLDGEECWQHLPSLLSMPNLAAIQWTAGDGSPDAGDACWDDLYAQIRGAGKNLWVELKGRDRIANADRLVKKFGAEGFYFLFEEFDNYNDALDLIRHAERDWKC